MVSIVQHPACTVFARQPHFSGVTSVEVFLFFWEHLKQALTDMLQKHLENTSLLDMGCSLQHYCVIFSKERAESQKRDVCTCPACYSEVTMGEGEGAPDQ